MGLRLKLLGGFRAELDAVAVPLPRKAQALLAFLALSPDRPQPRTKLATLLWGESPEAQARSSLRQTLFLLRRPLLERDPALLILDAHGVGLRPGAVEVDVHAFRRLAADRREAALHEAVVLYGGPLLDGLVIDEPEFESWLIAERVALHETAVTVL